MMPVCESRTPDGVEVLGQRIARAPFQCVFATSEAKRTAGFLTAVLDLEELPQKQAFLFFQKIQKNNKPEIQSTHYSERHQRLHDSERCNPVKKTFFIRSVETQSKLEQTRFFFFFCSTLHATVLFWPLSFYGNFPRTCDSWGLCYFEVDEQTTDRFFLTFCKQKYFVLAIGAKGDLPTSTTDASLMSSGISGGMYLA